MTKPSNLLVMRNNLNPRFRNNLTFFQFQCDIVSLDYTVRKLINVFLRWSIHVLSFHVSEALPYTLLNCILNEDVPKLCVESTNK